MKKIILFLFLFSIIKSAPAQIMDLTMDDCDGQTHNFYSELDSGKIIIIEFVMTCQICIDGGISVEQVISDFNSEFPGVARFYQFAYTSSYDCNTMNTFRTSGNFNSEVFEANNHLMAEFGGFGMPTVGIAAGANHDIIYSSVGYSSSDTAQTGIALRNFMHTLSINKIEKPFTFSATPNPASDFLNVSINLQKKSDVDISIFNAEGKLVDHINAKDFNMGTFQNNFHVSEFAAGFYTLRIDVNGQILSDRVQLIR